MKMIKIINYLVMIIEFRILTYNEYPTNVKLNRRKTPSNLKRATTKKKERKNETTYESAQQKKKKRSKEEKKQTN